MSVRRPPLMRKRPSADHAAAESVRTRMDDRIGPSNNDVTAATDNKGVAANQSIMDEFFSALESDPNMDPDMLETLRENAKSEDLDVDVEDLMATMASKSTWVAAVENLSKSGELAESEVNDLIRRIDQALAPLRRRESQIAVEFGRRMRTEGHEKALAWYRSETAKLNKSRDEHSSSSKPAIDQDALAGANEVVNSRSRRLRGPPRRR